MSAWFVKSQWILWTAVEKKRLVSKIISLFSNLMYQAIKDYKHIYATQEIVPDISSLNGQLVGKVLHKIWF